MKKLADISSFESLGNNNAAFVSNTQTRRNIQNSIFSKGASGELDRALMARRGMALLKEGASILAQLGVKGAAISAIATGSAINAVYKIPKAVAGIVAGRDPEEEPGFPEDVGKLSREITRAPLLLGDWASDKLDEWANKDEETIKKLRQIKAKGRRYNK